MLSKVNLYLCTDRFWIRYEYYNWHLLYWSWWFMKLI